MKGNTQKVRENTGVIRADFNKRIELDFDGGLITSDAGLFLYREFEKKVPFIDMLEKRIHFHSHAGVHEHREILRQMVYAHIAGYEDDIDADSLRRDPLLPHLLERDQLASQPTISRFMNFYAMTDVWAFQRGNMDVVASVESGMEMKDVVLDFDTTDITTHGEQQGGRHNPYYGQTIRQAMLCFNNLGNCLKANLYNGTASAFTTVKQFCKSPILHYIERNIGVRIRGDAMFGSEELYSWCESKEVKYFIRVRSHRDEDSVRAVCGENINRCSDNPDVYWGDYISKSPRWSRSRRICFQVHKKPGQLFADVTCVITNDHQISPREAVEFYFGRCACENHIKEGKLGFSWRKLSHTAFQASALRIQIQVLAYNLNNLLRRFCLPFELRHHHIDTIRMKIIKIGARIVKSSRRIIIRCSRSYPFHHLFSEIHANILLLRTSSP